MFSSDGEIQRREYYGMCIPACMRSYGDTPNNNTIVWGVSMVQKSPLDAIQRIRECIGDASRYHFRAAYVYRRIAMRLNRAWFSHVGFGNGRASVLTSPGNGGLGRKTAISQTYTLHDSPLTLIVQECALPVVRKSLLDESLHFCIESSLSVGGPV